MKTFEKTYEYSPFNDVYVPYIVDANRATSPNKMLAIWNALANSPLPLFTRWALYNALRSY